MHILYASRTALRRAHGTDLSRAPQSLIEFSEVTKKAGKFGEKTVSISKEELARLRAAASGAPAASAAPRAAPKAAPKPAPRPAGKCPRPPPPPSSCVLVSRPEKTPTRVRKGFCCGISCFGQFSRKGPNACIFTHTRQKMLPHKTSQSECNPR
jgi:hypothetical protein